MKNYKLSISLVAIMLLALMSESNLFAQEALQARPSPLAIATFKQDDAYIKVTYGRPHKKGRDIFGDLVPYGEVWRLGANEATEITFTEKVKIAESELAAGTYTLFAIPNEKEWTLIFNKDLGQWGAYRYDEKKDVLRIQAKVEKNEDIFEPFTITFNQSGETCIMSFMWDDVKVSVPITIE